MSLQVVGPWMLAVLGAALIGAGVILLFRRETQVPLVLVALLFGVLLSGTGIFGVGFLDSYARFLKTSEILNAVLQSPSDETYANALNAVDEGKVDPAQRQMLLAYMVARPTPQLDELLQRKAAASKSPTTRAAMLAALDDSRGREASAALITAGLAARNQVTPEAVKSLDEGSQIRVARQFVRNPKVAEAYKVDSRAFTNLSEVRPSFPQK